MVKWVLIVWGTIKSLSTILYGDPLIGYLVFAVILYAIVKKPSSPFQISNIYKRLHINSDGLFIITSKYKKFYHSNNLGDLMVSNHKQGQENIVVLSSKIESEGKELPIMRVLESNKYNSSEVLQRIASRMIDTWL